MKKTENADIDLIITRYLEGLADPEEKNELERWISISGENRRYFDQIKNIWEISDRRNETLTIDQDRAFEKVLQRLAGENRKINLWSYWQKIAAVMLIPILAANLLWLLFDSNVSNSESQTVYNEVFAPFGTRTELKLPDGSSVWLNSGSSLKYPEKFRGKERLVHLNGEAYFDVAGNPSRPFIVQTTSIAVKATGTEFNVSDYTSDNRAGVALVSGKVSVRGLNGGNDNPLTELKPNQLFELVKESGKTSVTNEDMVEYTSWKDGRLIFRNKPLSYVIRRISLVFNVDIELKGEVLQDYRYRATFEDESLTEILRLLKVSAPIDYLEADRELLPDGSFSRRKVVIYPRTGKY
jgi:ferric-dicitrate binding protein FerR (iron transport regulator)